MPTKDSRIDTYIAKSADFAKPILKHLRELVHAGCPNVEETMKWNSPHFDHKGILCSMGAHKQHCTFGFWKGALIFEGKKVSAAREDEAMGQFGRITRLTNLPADKILLGYIKKAAQLNEAGIKLPPRPKAKVKKELVVPDDLTAALKKNKKALTAFGNLSYSHKKEYLEWITEAKRDETRKRRLETTVKWLAEGRSRVLEIRKLLKRRRAILVVRFAGIFFCSRRAGVFNLQPAMKHILKVTIAIGMFSVAPAMMGQDAPKAEGTPAAASSPRPGVAFSETTFDFGKVRNTGVLAHDFIVTNTGNAILEITAVNPGCGCTMAGQWDRQVQPGQTGKIPIQFNPVSFNGPVSKTVTVTCNEPAPTTHVLQLHATVVRAYDVQPPYVSFAAVEGDDTAETKSVRIINNTDEDIAPETPRSPNPIFKTELKTVRPGKEFELLVTYSGPVSNAQPSAAILINVASNAPPLSVTAIATPQPAFVTGPPPIPLSAGPLPAQHRAPAMTIRNNMRTPVTLSTPAVNVEGVTVQMHETTPGKAFTLNLSFPPDFQTKSGQVIEVAVKTSDPKHPVITVPVFNVAVSQAVPPPPPTLPTPPLSLPGNPK